MFVFSFLFLLCLLCVVSIVCQYLFLEMLPKSIFLKLIIHYIYLLYRANQKSSFSFSKSLFCFLPHTLTKPDAKKVCVPLSVQYQRVLLYVAMIRESSTRASTWRHFVIWQLILKFRIRTKALVLVILLNEFPFPPSPALHLLLPLVGTWLRRTWRTPPSGWERASAPQCAPCWALLCTERFSNSDDRSLPSSSSFWWLCPSCSKDSKSPLPRFSPPQHKQEKTSTLYMHYINIGLVVLFMLWGNKQVTF